MILTVDHYYELNPNHCLDFILQVFEEKPYEGEEKETEDDKETEEEFGKETKGDAVSVPIQVDASLLVRIWKQQQKLQAYEAARCCAQFKKELRKGQELKRCSLKPCANEII